MKQMSPVGGAEISDEALAAISAVQAAVRTPEGGWLRAWRQARGVSQRTLAAKLGCRRQAWAQFEASEARGAISLYSLRRAADVLGCELVYCLVPRERETESSASVGRERAVDTPAGQPEPAPAPDDTWSEPELPTELR